MTALVIAEHDNAAIKGATLNTITAAKACGGDVFGEAVGQAFGVGVQHLGHACDLRGSCCGGSGVVASDQNVYFATASERGGDGVERGTFDGAVVVFGNNQNCHFLMLLR